MSGHPIFFDPKGRRAKATNIVIAAAGLVFLITIAGIAVGISTTRNGRTPALRQPNTAASIVTSSYLPTPVDQPLPTFTQDRQVPAAAKKTLRFAFLPGNTPEGFFSLKKHAKDIDAVIANWLELLNAPNGFTLRLLRGRFKVSHWLADNDSRVLIYPEINSHLTADELLRLLSQHTMRRRLIDQIAKYLALHNFPGVVFDARVLPQSGRYATAVFVSELETKLKATHRKLLLLVSAAISRQQLRGLAGIADYIVAATDLESDGGPSGAPAAQGWFEQRMRHFLAVVPPSKLIITIGSYCLDTDLAGERTFVPVQRGWDIMARKKAKLVFDPNSLNGTFTYHDRRGLPHRAWLLDGATVFNQTKAALAADPAGIALWGLGYEDPSAWRSFGRNALPDSPALAALKSIQPGYGAFGAIKGVALSALPGHAGQRSISYDGDLGLIVDEHMKRLPSVAKITASPPVAKDMVALTFDDGPDPRYTGRILDILARKHVHATFYVIGRSALVAPALVKREYLQGNDVGSHTFTHVDPTKASRTRLAVELNATARILRDITGIRTHLFRPPYAGPGLTYLDANPRVAIEATKLGYLIGEFGVDTCDYCGLSPSWIVSGAVNGVVNQHHHVVLLHDGGGNRNATVAALPKIIDKLRAADYRLVTTHTLLGLPRAAILQRLPPVGVASDTEAAIWRVAIAAFSWIANAIPVVAIDAAVLGILRMMLVAMMAQFQSRRRRQLPSQAAYCGRVAVLVPAYNEQPTICKTVDSILGSTVAERLEVIVIDDGSTDGTYETLMSRFRDDPRVHAIRKQNGGKASALNAGIAGTTAAIVVAIDGDTILLPDAIERLTTHFADPSIGAVAGNVTVGNRTGLVAAFQTLEYVTSQNLDRRAFELFNAIGVVPGAIGAWRRDALVQVGGYSSDTLAEDAELTLKLERRGWRIIGESEAYALTEVPETVRGFLKQRFRWMLGTLQAAFKHAGALLEHPKGMSLVTIPNIFVFQFGFTLVAPLMDALLLFSLAPFMLAPLIGTTPDDATLLLIAKYWIVFQVVDFAAAAVGIHLEQGRGYWRLLPLVFPQRFSYRQLLYVAAVMALLAAIKGTLAGWGKLKRTGNVSMPHGEDLRGRLGTSKA